MTRHQLELSRHTAERALMPGAKRGEVVEAIRITVYGAWFPQRALQPELLVGDSQAERVTIAPDERSIHGYLRTLPPDGSRIVVRYGSSQEGALEQTFHRHEIRSLPRDCQGGAGRR